MPQTASPSLTDPASCDLPSSRPSPRRGWWKAIAAGSFLFFLAKGLVWLAVVGTAVFQIAQGDAP